MKTANMNLFGDCLVPEVALPTIGYLLSPNGEWHQYCRNRTGFNAVLPVSWETSYREAV